MLAAIVSSAAAAAAGNTIDFKAGAAGQYTVEVNGAPWFKSGATFYTAGGKRHVTTRARPRPAGHRAP